MRGGNRFLVVDQFYASRWTDYVSKIFKNHKKMAFQKIIYDILILKRSELVPAALVHCANGAKWPNDIIAWMEKWLNDHIEHLTNPPKWLKSQNL